MVLEKDPPKNKEARESVLDTSKDPVAGPKDKKKEEVRQAGGGYLAQAQAVSAREQVPESNVAPPAEKKDPVTETKALFARMNLPQSLVPSNLESARYDPAKGTLTLVLKNSFSKRFDEENTITFERTISAHIENGALTGISGIRRGSASIVSIKRQGAGQVAITGKLGPFSKTLTFKDEQLPSLP